MAPRSGSVRFDRAHLTAVMELGRNVTVVWLYLKANAAERQWVKPVAPRQTVTIAPGQTLVSRNGISESTGIPASTVDDALHTLEKNGWIGVVQLSRKATRGSVKGPRLVTLLRDAICEVSGEERQQPSAADSLCFAEVGGDARLGGAVPPQRCEKSPSREWKAGYR